MKAKRASSSRSSSPLCPHLRYRLVSAHKGHPPPGEVGDPSVVGAVCLDCAAFARMLAPLPHFGVVDMGPSWVTNGSLKANLAGAEHGPQGWRFELLPLGCGGDTLAVYGPADWARVCAAGKVRAELEHETRLQRLDAYALALVERDNPTTFHRVPLRKGRICGS